MKLRKHMISRVLPDSIAEELGLEPGDRLVSVNGQPVEDIFDYRYLMNEEFVVLEVEKANGEIWELEVEKEYEEDLGITFEKDLMDDYRSCSNHCIFCFIDQMPPGMRDTLYFKDDDSRLSFIQGNYVTLTNMSDHDIDRIIRYHLEPINISIQTMNPELRCKMLHNRFAGDALKKLQKLYDAGITIDDVSPDYVVVGETTTYGYEHILRAMNLVNKGAKLIATNTDITGPIEGGIAPACRAFVAPIEATTGKQAY